MSSKQKTSLSEIGGALLILGIGVHVALWLGALVHPLANLAILAGIVLLIVGIIVPGRR
jgi:hypothetical protein